MNVKLVYRMNTEYFRNLFAYSHVDMEIATFLPSNGEKSYQNPTPLLQIVRNTIFVDEKHLLKANMALFLIDRVHNRDIECYSFFSAANQWNILNYEFKLTFFKILKPLFVVAIYRKLRLVNFFMNESSQISGKFSLEKISLNGARQ